MDKRALFFPCGLVLASAYVSTAQAIDYSFALDKPLHTVGVLLLLTGLAIVALEAWLSPNSHPRPPQPPRPPARIVAIALSEGQRSSCGEETWTEEWQPAIHRGPAIRAIGVCPAVLVFSICGRIAVLHRVLKDVECTVPSMMPFLPLVLALYHSISHTGQRQHPASSADSRPRTYLDRIHSFAFDVSTRYITPAILLSISCFLSSLKVDALRSTYICPVANSAATVIASLQFIGFLLDCVIVQVLYRLTNDGISSLDERPIQRPGGTSSHSIIGLAFVASSLLLLIAGIILYPTMPEHRKWMLSFPSEYLLGLLRLSLMIPFMTLCFLKSARLTSVMSAVLCAAFASAFVGLLRALESGVSQSFPPKPVAGLVLCLCLLTIALVIHLLADTNLETRIRSTVPVRLGRNQFATLVVLLAAVKIGVVVCRRLGPVVEHPVFTLIQLATTQHDQWVSQACRSRSLAEAVLHYQRRYKRDPPPHFDKWYEFAVTRNSIVIDDYDNIEEDLAPFSSFNADDLRLRTATVLATSEAIGGVRIRDGKAEVLPGIPGTHRWMMDGSVTMLQQFAGFLPDMDLAMNLQDEPRVAVPYERIRDALENPQPYPTPAPSNPGKQFSLDRANTWPNPVQLPVDSRFFEDHRLQQSFQTYGSLACSPKSRARKERHWNSKGFCNTCTRAHSMGAFVANWTLSADPCHQPDLANLHGMHLSPSSLMGTHDIVPIFSQSRAPGYVDIRYPSLWNYMDKTKYEFNEKFPDAPFKDKENVLFWRGTTTEGWTSQGTWKGMLRQRLVHLVNNETSLQPILLPKSDYTGHFEYILKHTSDIKRLLGTKTDIQFVDKIVRCAGQDCIDQTREFGLVDKVDIKQNWRYRYLFDADGSGFSGRFIPFLRSNSVVLKTALFREWYEGRLTAWKHFVPIDLRLHDLFSSLAYFGGYDAEDQSKRRMEGRTKDAEAIARQGKVWAEKVLRKEDMEVYMFRLLLEWGRLTDDRRTEVGFRMGKGMKGGRIKVEGSE